MTTNANPLHELLPAASRHAVARRLEAVGTPAFAHTAAPGQHVAAVATAAAPVPHVRPVAQGRLGRPRR